MYVPAQFFIRTRIGVSGSPLKSELTNIIGINTKTAQKLLQELGSIKQIALTPEDQLAEIVGPSAANRVHAWFVTKQGKAKKDAPTVPPVG